jgi:serine O-acetyltransferase
LTRPTDPFPQIAEFIVSHSNFSDWTSRFGSPQLATQFADDSHMVDDDWTDLYDYLRKRTERLRHSLMGLGIPDTAFAPYFNAALQYAASDLIFMVSTDPAAQRSRKYVMASYGTYAAIMDYRIAHQISKFGGTTSHPMLFAIEARKIADEAKVRTSVDIHPDATFGEGLKIDHGAGTVIGGDVQGGVRNTFMQGVVIGARTDREMNGLRRHPTLGDDVTVYAFAKILGPVTIGNSCVIGPECLVTESLLDGSNVRLAYSMTVVRAPAGAPREHDPEIFGVEGTPDRCCRISGRHLSGWHPRIIDHQAGDFVDLVSFDCDIFSDEIHIRNARRIVGPEKPEPCLLLERESGVSCRVLRHAGLTHFFEGLQP